MVWLFGQVWILCAVAFLAGAAVTWLVFVRPQRRRDPADPRAHGSAAVWVPGRTADPDEAPPPAQPPPVAEPALAALDTSGAEHAPRRPGTTAAEALDRLGVAGATAPEAAIDVPKQRTRGNDEDDR